MDRNPNASGFADKLLTLSLDHNANDINLIPKINVAIGEGKSSWIYTSGHLESIFEGKLIDENGCVILASNDRDKRTQDACELLKQLYGQFHYLGAKVGFVTNLHHIIMVLHDKEKGNLILSPLMEFTDGRVLTCLVGMTFISIDAHSRPHTEVNATPPWAFIRNALAPESECYQITYKGISTTSADVGVTIPQA
ncbi:hypothetical protein CC2G_012282 [Coprinopsis cinerea AmutBmut pab1-1]|nr:hypothetical protein CC2G_012282 [Coprinopsis cinerea AmutBmut pab1-1]